MKNEPRLREVRWFRALRFGGGAIWRLLWHPKVIGKKNIPRRGGAVICYNHKAGLDPFLAEATAGRVLHPLAAGYLFDLPVIGKLIKSLGAIRVNRAKDGDTPHTGDPLGQAVKILKAGGAIYINPEGTRNRVGQRDRLLLKLHSGAARMAIESGAKLIPAAIIGRYKIFGRSVKLIVGEPLDLTNLDAKRATEKLRQAMLKLLKDGGDIL
ncbi:MAG: 1-acyl-sn-glycerol-3-phosphate acyltransferase [Candidatus Nomurabacteria bacterium]|jgi:1-acyl-sn-glycerol-3-phosphate acyltransferase|nr:1-acyl-sn-glycerol-3-phosphate acyltransferase [Candidatus Nomurabacteria bacterium]